MSGPLGDEGCTRGTLARFLNILLLLVFIQPQLQTFLLVETVNALMVEESVFDFPALAQQKQMQSLEAITYPRSCQIPQPDAKRRSIFGLAFITLGRTANPCQMACLSLTDAKADAQKLTQHPFLRRLYSFFAITSWSMCLSRDRSATRDLSFLFSSSSCLRRRFLPQVA